MAYMTFSNFTFDQHLRDLFDVIDSLRNEHNIDLGEFLYFVHSRAFRKLAWRVLEFSTHWGQLPFLIFPVNGDQLEKKDFEIRLPHSSHAIFEVCGLGVSRIPVPNTELIWPKVTYSVESHNVSKWVQLFKFLWQVLESKLLKEAANGGKTLRKDKPKPDEIELIVDTITSLQSLRPVLKYLLSVEEVAEALSNAGIFGFFLNPWLLLMSSQSASSIRRDPRRIKDLLNEMKMRLEMKN